MQDENQALLAYLEKHEGIPPPDRRLMLNIVGRNLIYLSEQDQRRYQHLLGQRPQR